MQTFLGMILGAVLLEQKVDYRLSQAGRTIVNWDVASNDWNAMKTRAHQDWIRLSSR